MNKCYLTGSVIFQKETKERITQSQSLENKIKYWRCFIYSVCITMLIAPYNRIFMPGDNDLNDEWVRSYALTSLDLFIVVIPLILLAISIPMLKHRKIRIFSILALCMISGLVSLLALLFLCIPMQDIIPDWGMLILIIFFPIVVVDSIVEWNKQ